MTDEQLIARLSYTQHHRRRIGYSFLTIGVIGSGFLMRLAIHFDQKAVALLDDLKPIQTPSAEQMQRGFEAVQFHLGLFLGFAICTGFVSMMALVLSGLSVLCFGKKERLLLKCWDQLHAN